MKNRLFLFLLVSGLLLLTACGGDGAAVEDSTTPVSAADRIRSMEDSLYAKPYVDRKGAQALLDVYLLQAKSQPLDALTPQYLFNAAGVKRSLGDPRGGIALYDRVIANYANWPGLKNAYYMKAFCMDNDLHQKGEAERAYQLVVDKFPDDPLAADAAQAIVNLRFTDEELIQKFERLNADSAQAKTRPVQ